jgi:hypothetical protein
MQAGTLTGVRYLDRDVLMRLSYEDLLRACTTNKSLSNYCKDDNFWKAFILNKFPSVTTKTFQLHNVSNMTENETTYTYSTWREYAEAIFTNAQLFIIPTGILPPDLKSSVEETSTEGPLSYQEFKELLDVAYAYLKHRNIKRGDIIYFEDFTINSDDFGRFIYDGKSLGELSYIPESGGVPSMYTIDEFIDPSRWFTSPQPIASNTLVWADFSKPIYQVVFGEARYVIFKRDSVYYTVVDNPNLGAYHGWVPTNNASDINDIKQQFNLRSYYYDASANDVYNDIRDKLRGYVMISGIKL